MEIQRGEFILSDDASRLDLDAICDFLSHAYWADNRTRATIERSIEHSLNFAIFHADEQIGFARVVSDFAVFAYICDVFVREDYRGRALGKWLMETILAHPKLQNLRRWCLVTRDAHGLYGQYGFVPLERPGAWLERFDPSA